MMKLKSIVCMGIFFAAFIGVVYNAEAFTINGYLDDWGVAPGVYGLSDWEPDDGILYVEEDQISYHLGPGGGGQLFDAEALYWTMDASSIYIALVTGMPPSGALGNSAGDIFIDFASVNDYGIETIGSKAGTLYKNAGWTSALYTSSSPANIIHDPNKEVGLVSFAYAYTYPHTNALYRHYVMEMAIPKTDLGNDWMSAGRIHWTQTCGNDAIDLDTPAIPEPASMLLFGLGMLSFGFMKRKGV